MATVQPEYTSKLLKKCKFDRFGADGEAMKSEVIDMDPFWQDELKDFPQFTKSKGRMLNLLKEKSKVGYKPKDRKKFRPYLPEDQSSSVVNLQPLPFGSQQPSGGNKKIQPQVLENYDAGKDKKMGN